MSNEEVKNSSEEDVYLCFCGGFLKKSHVDDIGTVWFKCTGCERTVSLAELERNREKTVETLRIEHENLTRPLGLEELSEILNSTIKHDKRNKLITFLSMLLTYTEEDQINVSFTAESSTGKSYIPLELAWYFPRQDIIEYSYVSPTAFYHEYGVLLPDPTDKRDVEEEKRRKIIVIDLCKKILIFLDQPHDLLLQRLRPLLSHDRKKLISKITDRHKKGSLQTKTVLIEGFPTVLFCTAKFSMEDQERTRLLLLSPETSQVKIKDSILLRIEKESNRQAFQNFMESDENRKWLNERVYAISLSHVKYIIIPEELRVNIAEKFFKTHNSLIPRHQRDIGRLLALIKAHAMLNLWHRERLEDSVLVAAEDVLAGFKLYEEISVPNELGLPPEVFNIYAKLQPKIKEKENGITIKEFQKEYYKSFHRTIGKKRLEETLNLLQAVGLITEEPDPNDRRQKLLACPGVFNFEEASQHENDAEKINTPQGVSNPTIPEIYEAFRNNFKGPFEQQKALDLIIQLRKCDLVEAEKIFQTFVEESKVFRDSEGLWRF